MFDATNCLLALSAAWNERDQAQIRGHVDRAVAEDFIYADPMHLLHGRDAFAAMLSAFRTQFSTAKVLRTSGIDAHHNRVRYAWAVSVEGKTLVAGTDIALVDGDGLISRIDGFFGPIPPHEDAG